MKIDPNDFPTPDTWFQLIVSYGETDAAGVVYYGEYLHWFERARGQLLRELGLPYSEIAKRGILLPVRQASCRYLKSAHHDEEIFVRTAVASLGRASMRIVYQVWGPPHRATLLAVGETEHAAIGPNGRPTPLPEWLTAVFEKRA